MSDLLPYLRLFMRYRARLALGTVLMLATAASGIGLLALSGWFITATAVTGVLLAAGVAVAFDIYMPGGGIRAFAVTRTVSRYFERIVNHDTVLQLLRDLRVNLFKSIARLPPTAAVRLRSGELLNRLTTDIDRLDGLFLRGIAPPIVAVLAIVITMLLLLFGSVALSLSVGLTLLALAGLSLGRGWLKGQASTSALAESNAQLRAGTIDHLQGLADLQAFGSLRHHRDRLLTIERYDHALNADTNIRVATGESILAAGLQLSMVGVLLFSLYLYGTGTVSGAIAVMMPLALMALLEPLGVLPAAGWHLARARASAVRLREDMNQTQKSAHTASRTDIVQSDKPTLCLTNIYLTRGAGATVLNNVSLTIQPGECVGIVGASGSGKSSLASLLTAQLTADSGSIFINGHRITAIAYKALFNQIACLTQQTDLFSTTIADNLRIAESGNSRTGTAKLWEVLEAVQLAEFVENCPGGLNTWVGESGTRLSQGQARRLALARVLLRDPPAVLLDEPFSGLDSKTAEKISDCLAHWLQGRTTLLLGHDRKVLPPADRWFHLENGDLKPIDS